MARKLLLTCWLVLVLGACAPAAAPPAPAAGAGAAPTVPAASSTTAPTAPVSPTTVLPPAPAKVPAAYSAASGAQMVILLADYAGLFRERGLEVDLPLLGADRAVQSLVAGQIAFATIPGSQLVNAAVGGAPVVAVAQDMDTVGMAIHAGPAVRTLADLRGKRMGITTPGTLTDLVARVVARLQGMQAGADLALINVGSVPDLVPALSVGAIDAAPLSMPTSLRAREAGFPEIADVAALGPTARIIGNHLASRRDFLAEQPDVAQRFVDAYAAAVRRAREDPATAQAALMHWLQLDDPALAEATYAAYVRLLKDPPVTSAAAWRALLDVMAELPEINPAVRTTAPESLMDPRWVRG